MRSTPVLRKCRLDSSACFFSFSYYTIKSAIPVARCYHQSDQTENLMLLSITSINAVDVKYCFKMKGAQFQVLTLKLLILTGISSTLEDILGVVCVAVYCVALNKTYQNTHPPSKVLRKASVLYTEPSVVKDFI